MKLPLWINSCRVEERSVRLVYKTKMVTDWQKTLGIWQNQSVTGVYFPNWKGPGERWYRDWRRVTRGLCRASRRYKPRRRRWWGWRRICNIWPQDSGANPATAESSTILFQLCVHIVYVLHTSHSIFTKFRKYYFHIFCFPVLILTILEISMFFEVEIENI